MQRRQNIITWHVTAWHLTCRHWSVTRQRVSDSKLSFDGWHGDAGHYPSMGQWLKIIIWCVTQGRWALSRDTGSLGIIASTGQGQIINWCVTWGRWALSRQWVRDKLSTDAWHRDAGHYRVNRLRTIIIWCVTQGHWVLMRQRVNDTILVIDAWVIEIFFAVTTNCTQRVHYNRRPYQRHRPVEWGTLGYTAPPAS